MDPSNQTRSRVIQGLKVQQWLPDWDVLEYDESAHRRRPRPFFYLFSLSASELKALTGIRRRDTTDRAVGQSDTGVQRGHDQERSAEIKRFTRFGFPWSALSEARRNSGKYNDLKKPGWLPTSIVVNILDKESSVQGSQDIFDDDLITLIDSGEGTIDLQLPRSFTGSDWKPTGRHPIEVIDGQHRLWAFEESGQPSDYQLPVVAFHGLDLSWQAYLFYTINIKPVKINASLAFDLYPLLRTEDWLERFEGPEVYREARSQELTQALWGIDSSPWYKHINMLGERGLRRMVRQAAWIRSLMATYVKSTRGTRIGGLFGGKPGSDFLPWNGAQQAAFLILMGQKMRDAVVESDFEWVEVLRDEDEFYDEGEEKHPAFYGANSLLNTDQGIRGLLFVTNDLCYVMADVLELENWFRFTSSGASDPNAIEEELNNLRQLPVADFLDELSFELAKYDWRTSAATGLTEEQRVQRAAYRGSSGYKEIRLQLLEHLLTGGTKRIADAASNVYGLLGYK